MFAYLIALGLLAVGLRLFKTIFDICSTAWAPGLNRFPSAHWSVPYSQAWIFYQRWSRNEHTARRLAHERLGNVVRLGPRELSINCVDSNFKTVYGGSWDKSDIYATFENYGHHSLFATVGSKEHAVRRRLLAKVYTTTYIDNSPDVAKLLSVINEDRLLPLLREEASKKAKVNVFPRTQSYFMDVVTAYLYGLQNGTNFLQRPVEAAPLLSALRTSLGPDTFFLQNFPRITYILSRLGCHLVPQEVFECFPVYLRFGQELHNRTKLQPVTETVKPEDRTSSTAVVWSHFRQALIDVNTKGSVSALTVENEKPTYDPELDTLVAAELLDHLHAAHLTSGILASFVLWELSRRPDIQKALISELRYLRSQGQDPAHSPHGLLDRVLLETARLHPPAFGPFPRVAPSDGARFGTKEGEHETDLLPGGTVVSASVYALGRNSTVFERPDEWEPSRWETSAERGRQMQKWVWAFGGGDRACIGRHLAELAIKSLLTSVYSNFTTELAATDDQTDMTQVESMMSPPKAKELTLIFRPLDEKNGR